MKLPKGFKIIGPDFYRYQYKSFLFGIERNNAGLLLDLGLGKTRTAIEVARYRIQFNDVNRVLVVCPTSVMKHWADEVKFWSEYEPMLLYGSKDERLWRLDIKGPRFFIINYEYMHPLLEHLKILKKVKELPKAYKTAEKQLMHHKYRGTLTPMLEKSLKQRMSQYENQAVTKKYIAKDYEKKIKNLGFDMMIFDESARYLKTWDTDRTQASKKIADLAGYKLLLTATPISNRPMDLFAQFLVLDGGRTFMKNFFQFRNFFFRNIGQGQYKKWALRKDRVKIMHKRLYSSCIRFKKEDVLENLPPIMHKKIRLPMSKEFKKQYESLERQVLTEIETADTGRATVTVKSVLTKFLRLQQFTGGFAYDIATEQTKKVAETPKLDALVEQVQTILDAEESVIIWCRFLPSMDLIKATFDKLGIKNVAMSGRDNAKQKGAKWQGFQNSKSINVFIGQVESGGLGIELFKKDSSSEKTQYMIFYENIWTLDVRQQAEGRIHRIGQNSTCYYIDLVVEDSIDERILKVLQTNQTVADYILDYGHKAFLKGE